MLSNICILYHAKCRLTIALFFEVGLYSPICLQYTVVNYSMILLYINAKQVTVLFIGIWEAESILLDISNVLSNVSLAWMVEFITNIFL